MQMDAVVILLILAFPIASVYVLFYHKKRVDGLSEPPGPPGLPFIGNFYQLYKAPCIHEYLCTLSKRYGSLMTLRMGSVPILVVSSPKMAKEVLKTQDLAYCSRPMMTGMQKLSYNGLDVAFSPYSEHWRQVRKFCTLELFTQKRAQIDFRHVHEQEVSRMIARLSETAAASKDVNAFECFSNLATSIISRVAFGKRHDEDGIGKERLQRMLSELDTMLSVYFVSDFFPMFGWIDSLTGMRARLDRTFKEMDMFYEELIDDHLKPDRPESLTEDIIDVMLKNKGCSSSSLTKDTMKAILLNVFNGGTGTSASLLVWAMTALMRNRGVMKKVQEEIRSVIGKKGNVDEDDIQNLPYLRAVVKETMRLYPTGALLIPRKTIESSIIGEDKDHMYMIKPKTLVYVSMWAIGRDPEIWKNPMKFVPERFLERHDINYQGQQFEYIPFGAGRRICPGIHLGLTTVELALANLLYTFNWEPPVGTRFEDINDETVNGITLQKKNALYIRPKTYMFS
uniref:5-OH-xanthotoxin synthase n=1 Tax=Ammi majus TaxID=48026 RepID=C71Z1_AMMMJ|nr:RecName: Full=5-OH-xanthotoxin synthase; AltName: Full=Cytochrome P450 CYP71AZ1 [Ammi majus]ABO32529.1 cytochrome P450-dependent monooxygenase-like protein [Ammi majus]